MKKNTARPRSTRRPRPQQQLTPDERNLLATYRWLPTGAHRRFLLHLAAWCVDMARVFDDRPLTTGVLSYDPEAKKGGAWA